MNKIDPYTQEEFTPKRNNQIFANRENQIAFNNKKSRKKRELKSPINSILEKNRKIIKQILGENTKAVKSKDFLLGAGFDFTVFSHTGIIEGNEVRAIYTYGFYLNNNQTITLIKL